MVKSISLWAKNITLAIMVVSILEMLLPNKKIKKYIKVVMGLYILFNIISPIMGQDISIDLNGFIDNTKSQTVTTNPVVNQDSMNTRLQQIGEEEIQKDVIKKLEDKGYIVNSCKVEVEVKDKMNIKKIALKVEKDESVKTIANDDKKENNINSENDISVENVLVDEVQKVKKVQIGKNDFLSEKLNKSTLTSIDINLIKNLLIQEYEVKESCLKIN